jgi:hypothetical protein
MQCSDSTKRRFIGLRWASPTTRKKGRKIPASPSLSGQDFDGAAMRSGLRLTGFALMEVDVSSTRSCSSSTIRLFLSSRPELTCLIDFVRSADRKKSPLHSSDDAYGLSRRDIRCFYDLAPALVPPHRLRPRQPQPRTAQRQIIINPPDPGSVDGGALLKGHPRSESSRDEAGLPASWQM